MINDLLEFLELEDCDPEFLILGKVTFKKDFGPWKKGQNVKLLEINYEQGKMTEWTKDGKIINQVKIELKVKE
jgi:hypothetical protein